MEIDPAGQLHDCLDRYEMGDMGSLDQLQSYPGWSDALASGPGGFPLANLGGCEPRFSLAGNAYAEQASELLSSLSSARLPEAPLGGGGVGLSGPRHSWGAPYAAKREGDADDRWASGPGPVADAAMDVAPDDAAKGGWIGAYSPEARKRRLAVFHAKRERRVWTRKVKYDVRKNFADTRMRVKGRFVKKEDEDLLKELISIT